MKRILMILTALTLTMILGLTAFAETTETAAPAADATSSATVNQSDSSTENTALQEAIEAYQKARSNAKVSELEEELKAMVEAGTLTQEQADLIMSYVNETLALQNGTCPSCGYQFQNWSGSNGRGNGKQNRNNQNGYGNLNSFGLGGRR